MRDVFEELREFRIDCPEHKPRDAKAVTRTYRTPAIMGAAAGCDECMAAFLAAFNVLFNATADEETKRELKEAVRSRMPKEDLAGGSTLDGATKETMKRKALELGRLIDSKLPRGVHFTLFLFQVEGQWLEYIANCQREDMIHFLKHEFIPTLEGKKNPEGAPRPQPTDGEDLR